MPKKFYQVVDTDGDLVYNYDGDKSKRIETLEEAIALAEKKARDNEDDYIVMVGVKVVGVPKSPVEVADL